MTAALLLSSLIAVAAPAAVPTRVVVRVVAHDGKVLGTDSGGAVVKIFDADTHQLLASGTQNGNSGDTTQIMVTPHDRGDVFFASPKATSFSAVLPLARPRKLEIVAEGPLLYPRSKQKVSRTLWVLPGASMDPDTEDGIVMELYGFAMEFDAVTPAAGSLAVTAHVAMICGCPIDEGGPWPQSQFEVLASIRRAGAPVVEKKMIWSAKNTFTAAFDAVPAGKYELTVTASDTKRANFTSITRPVSVPAEAPASGH